MSPEMSMLSRPLSCRHVEYDPHLHHRMIVRGCAKAGRAERWSTSFIACIRHPERRCNRSGYVRKGNRKCSTCGSLDSTGRRKPSYLRHWKRRIESGLHAAQCYAYRREKRIQETKWWAQSPNP